MSMSNKELAKRADIAISDLVSNGGMLNATQANAFIDMIEEEPTILNQARVVRMPAPQHKINRLGFGSTIMKAAPQGTPPHALDDGTNDRYLAAADRSAPTTSQITLSSKEVMAEVHLPYELLEDNIEGQSFEDHVMRLIASRAAQDLEMWALTADTGSGDAYLALNDGLLKTAVSNIYDNASAGINPDVFEQGLLTMPQKYLRVLTDLRQFIPVGDTIKYRANVAKRATGYGDSALQGDGKLVAYGTPVEAAPLMPAATGLFTFPKNILFGIQRDVSVEAEKNIRSRQIIIVLTMRIDCKWDDEAAVVKYINI
ncbi:MAG: hypothetical protein BMS9Abin11_1010 [Gammaproteobacteria bacterium]|nr:MAG: hypothetical protein BMS9Abin11_1010 [Gammaproteobacteria bacterium]